jgi:hypothetical protein
LETVWGVRQLLNGDTAMWRVLTLEVEASASPSRLRGPPVQTRLVTFPFLLAELFRRPQLRDNATQPFMTSSFFVAASMLYNTFNITGTLVVHSTGDKSSQRINVGKKVSRAAAVFNSSAGLINEEACYSVLLGSYEIVDRVVHAEGE